MLYRNSVFFKYHMKSDIKNSLLKQKWCWGWKSRIHLNQIHLSEEQRIVPIGFANLALPPISSPFHWVEKLQLGCSLGFYLELKPHRCQGQFAHPIYLHLAFECQKRMGNSPISDRHLNKEHSLDELLELQSWWDPDMSFMQFGFLSAPVGWSQQLTWNCDFWIWKHQMWGDYEEEVFLPVGTANRRCIIRGAHEAGKPKKDLKLV